MIADAPVWLEWVERLGGWGVVCFVVWWMMRRSDARDKMLQAAFEKLGTAVDTFADVERNNRCDHEKILDTLDRVEQQVQAKKGGA
jgi:hypothetical protein